MYIYNVTTQLPARLETVWVTWMKENHIPALLALQCFSKAALHKLVEVQGQPADEEMVTYTAQYFTHSLSLYEHYISMHSEDMRRQATAVFGDQLTSFRTVMQQVHEA